MLDPPSVEAARPDHCPVCATPSRPTGDRLAVRGHGLRRRQPSGPQEPDGPPTSVVVLARRYRCVVCRAVIVVVPCELLPRRQYSACAIGLAVALYGVAHLHAADVRQRVSTWEADRAVGWITLRRWLRSVRAGGLFPGIRRCPAEWTLRQVAERTATTLAAWAPPSLSGLPLPAQAFHGAKHRP